jgi:hypothetical protein
MAINPSHNTESRKTIVKLSKDLSQEQMENLQSNLLALDGVLEIHLEKLLLDIEYEFPLSCFAEIWEGINETIDSSYFTLINRIRFSLSGFAEHNERDHLIYPRNWHTYVEDIYVHYYEHQQHNNNDVRKQLWRRYKKSS